MAFDYIPHNQEIFHNWQDNYLKGVVSNGVSWGISPGDITDLQNLQTIYNFCYQTGSKEQKLTRTSGHIKAFRTAQKNFIAAIRKFNARWISRNDLVTDAQRVDLGVTIRDKVPTRIEAVDFAPQIFVDKISVGVHRLRFKNPQEPGRMKMPKGQRIILRTAVGTGSLPEAQIPWSGYETVKKFLHLVNYTVNDKGKTAYYIACYESNRGERGPWSNIKDAIVV